LSGRNLRLRFIGTHVSRHSFAKISQYSPGVVG
jgi:hypothetical protein